MRVNGRLEKNKFAERRTGGSEWGAQRRNKGKPEKRPRDDAGERERDERSAGKMQRQHRRDIQHGQPEKKWSKSKWRKRVKTRAPRSPEEVKPIERPCVSLPAQLLYVITLRPSKW